MKTVIRNLGSFQYTANIVGTTRFGDQIEIDQHLGQTGVDPATVLYRGLDDVYHKRLRDLFAKTVFIPLKFTVSMVRSHTDAGEHFGSGSPFLYIGVMPRPVYDPHRIAAYAVCEMVEVYAATSGRDWDSATSHGEALSRFIGEAFCPGMLTTIESVAHWLNTPGRPDWITHTQPSETNQTAIGCALAFCHFVHDLLGVSLEDLVAAGGNTLELKYRQLFPGKTGGYAALRAAVDKRWPVGQPVPEDMAHENPFR